MFHGLQGCSRQRCRRPAEAPAVAPEAKTPFFRSLGRCSPRERHRLVFDPGAAWHDRCFAQAPSRRGWRRRLPPRLRMARRGAAERAGSDVDQQRLPTNRDSLIGPRIALIHGVTRRADFSLRMHLSPGCIEDMEPAVVQLHRQRASVRKCREGQASAIHLRPIICRAACSGGLAEIGCRYVLWRIHIGMFPQVCNLLRPRDSFGVLVVHLVPNSSRDSGGDH